MKDKKKKEFSKTLLVQESILVWLTTISLLVLSFICILKGYEGELPWLASMTALPWGAYAVSQACYYKKARIENSQGGIKYDSIFNMTEDETEVEEEEELG